MSDFSVRNLHNDFCLPLRSGNPADAKAAIEDYHSEYEGTDMFAEWGDMVLVRDLPGKQEEVIAILRRSPAGEIVYYFLSAL